MSELSQRLQWARVDYSATLAQTAWALLRNAPEIRGPGFTQADAVQAVTELAMLRDLVAGWNYARIAEFSPDGRHELWTAYGRRGVADLVAQIERRGNAAMPVVGDAPFVAPPEAVRASDPAKRWGQKLALALDEVMMRIGKAELGPNIPLGGQQVADLVALQLALIAVIVAGAALSVIGSVAAWRYLDPEFRRDALLVREAAENYAQRLDIFERTGDMPPPSDVENQAVRSVETMAAAREKTDWLTGGLVAGGITVGFVAVGLITRGLAEDRRARA